MESLCQLSSRINSWNYGESNKCIRLYCQERELMVIYHFFSSILVLFSTCHSIDRRAFLSFLQMNQEHANSQRRRFITIAKLYIKA